MSIIVTLIKFGPDDFIKQRPDSVEADLFIHQREITHSCAVRVADRMVTINGAVFRICTEQLAK